MGQSDRPKRDERRKGKGGSRQEDERAAAMRERANELTKAGMPFQMAMAVAQGRLELNQALERLARRSEVESLMRKHELSRALATQVVLGHADLEQFLAKRRLQQHREANLTRSCLDAAVASGEPLTVGLHGQRKETGHITATDAYTVTLAVDGAEPEEIHKLQFKYAHVPDDWKKVRRSLKKDKAVAAQKLEPIERPQDRYTISDKRLFRYMDQEIQVSVTLLEGEVFRGRVGWFGRYEFGLVVKGDVEIVIFRHALHAVGSV